MKIEAHKGFGIGVSKGFNRLVCRHCLPGIVIVLLLSAAGPVGAQLSVCGNGITELGEECDDGNLAAGDGCTLNCTVEEECYDPGNRFSFFVWSDSTTSAGDYGAMRVFRDAVNRMMYPERIIPRFWISTGDIPFMEVSNSYLDKLNDQISNSVYGQNYPFVCPASTGRFPYFVAIGNHDIDGYLTTTPQSQADYWSNYVGTRIPNSLLGMKNLRWGPHYFYDERTTYSFDYKNAHFIILNQYVGDPAFPTTAPLGCIRPELYTWIEQDLRETAQPIKLVFGHEPAWSYCSNLGGYGGSYCPIGSIDNQNPPYRPRPYSTTGDWHEAFGKHWGDSLEDRACPPGSQEAFWSLLAEHKVVANFCGHTHTYSSRLVEGDGTPRNDVGAYSKAGELFEVNEGVWEVNTGQAHNSSGSLYVLVTVEDNIVRFESYDQIGMTEPYHLVEEWSVRVLNPPAVEITQPGEAAAFSSPANVLLTAEASDSDGQVIQVSFYANSALIGIDTESPFEILWADVGPGAYTLTAVALDDSGATGVSIPVHIAVHEPSQNRPPVLSPIGNRSVFEETLLNFWASATDPDEKDILTYSLIGAPAGASIDPTSGSFRWTPGENQGPGTYYMTVRVTDNGSPPLSAEEMIRVTVEEVNKPPVLAPIGDRSVNEKTALSFTATASDPDLPANTLVFSLGGAPAGATIGVTTGTFLWTPGEEQGSGVYQFTVIVTDNGNPALSAQRPVTVTVNDLNEAPVLAAIGNKTVGENTLLSFTVSATDSDLPVNSLRFSLSGAPQGATIDAVTGLFTWIPTSQQVGSHTFTVLVSDDGSPSASDSETITVTVTVKSAPDLVLAALSTTARVVAPGGTLTVANTVKNQGSLSAGAFVVEFHLSLDDQFGGADDIAFAKTQSVTSLAAGASSSANTSLTVPSTTPYGSYYITAKVDSGNTVAEANEGNNDQVTIGTVSVSRADLVVTSVEPGLASVNAGSVLPITATVTNQGLLKSGSFRIAYRLSVNTIYGDSDDILISATRSVKSLAPGASNQGTINATIPSTARSGQYYVLAKVDSESNISELEETNNTAWSSSQVTIPAPDLIIAALSTSTTTVKRGGSFSLGNTLKNIGDYAAGSSVIGFHLSSDSLYGGADDIDLTKTRSVSSLGVGASSAASTSITVPSTVAPGTYYICAIADMNNSVLERDETNNARCTSQVVQVTP